GADDVDAIRTAADAAFDSWRAALTQALVRSGLDASTASDIAALSLAAVEGALILGRVARSDEVFDVLHRQLVRLVDDTAAGAP
ncbi:MAG: TetR/AcrR family transcriptional regulator, partial [Actinomycetota bacterium]